MKLKKRYEFDIMNDLYSEEFPPPTLTVMGITSVVITVITLALIWWSW